MRIALNGLTALKAWRSIRSGKAARATIGALVDLAAETAAQRTN